MPNPFETIDDEGIADTSDLFGRKFGEFLSSHDDAQRELRRSALRGQRDRFITSAKGEQSRIDESTNLQNLAVSGLLGLERGREGLRSVVGGITQAVGEGIGLSPLRNVAETMISRGRSIQDTARAARQEAAAAAEGLALGPVGRIAGAFAESGMISAPSIPIAGVAGLPGAAVAGGLISGTLTRDEAKQAFIKEGDDEATAERKSIMPAAVSGAATALVTGLFGARGAEALAGGIPKAAFQSTFRRVFRSSGIEGFEELSDEALQWANAKLSFNPDLTPDDLMTQMAAAFFMGQTLGAAIETPLQIAASIKANGPQEIERRVQAVAEENPELFGPTGPGQFTFQNDDPFPEEFDSFARRAFRDARDTRRRERQARLRSGHRRLTDSALALPEPRGEKIVPRRTATTPEEVIAFQKALQAAETPILPGDILPDEAVTTADAAAEILEQRETEIEQALPLPPTSAQPSDPFDVDVLLEQSGSPFDEGQTNASIALGLQVQSDEQLANLLEGQERVEAEAKTLRQAPPEGETNEQMVERLNALGRIAFRKQFFREAVEAATGTGSMKGALEQRGAQSPLDEAALQRVIGRRAEAVTARQRKVEQVPSDLRPLFDEVESVKQNPPAQEVGEIESELLPPRAEGFEYRIVNPQSFNASRRRDEVIERTKSTDAVDRVANVPVGNLLVDDNTRKTVPTFMSVTTAQKGKVLAFKTRQGGVVTKGKKKGQARKTSGTFVTQYIVPLESLIKSGLVQEVKDGGKTTGYQISSRVLDTSQWQILNKGREVLTPEDMAKLGESKTKGPASQKVRFERFDESFVGRRGGPVTVASEDEQAITADIAEKGLAAVPETDDQELSGQQVVTVQGAVRFFQLLSVKDPELADALIAGRGKGDDAWQDLAELASERLNPENDATRAQGIRDFIEDVRETLTVEGGESMLTQGAGSLLRMEMTSVDDVNPDLLNRPASGASGIRTLVNADNNGLNTSARETANLLLDLMPDQLFEGMTLEIRSGAQTVLGTGITFDGSFSALLRSAQVAAGSQSSTFVAEELAHQAATFLPDNLRNQAEQFRQEELQSVLDDPLSTEAEKALANRIVNDGDLTSIEYARAANFRDTSRIYPLINLDEFVASNLVSGSLRTTEDTRFASIKDFVHNLVDQFVRALKKIFNLHDQSRDEFFDEVIARFAKGEFNATVPGGALAVVNRNSPIGSIALTERQVKQEFQFANQIGTSVTDSRQQLGEIFVNTNRPLADMFSRVAEEFGSRVTPRIMRWVGFNNVQEAAEVTESLFKVDAQGYENAKATMPETLGNQLSRSMLVAMRWYESKLARVRNLRRASEARLVSDEFNQLMSSLAEAEITEGIQKGIRISFEASITSGLAAAQRIINDEQATEAQISRAQGEKTLWEKASELVPGLTQKAEDMVAALALDSTGQRLLQSDEVVNQDQLRSVLRRLPNPDSTRPLLETGDRKFISDIALFWVSRNVDSRQRAAALAFGRSDDVRGALNGIASRFAAAVGRGDHVQVLEVLRQSGDMATAENRARTVVRRLRSQITREMNRHRDLVVAEEFADRLETDVEWRALRDRVTDDTGEQPVPDIHREVGNPMFGQDFTIPLPDGRTVQVTFSSDKTEWEAEQLKAQGALDAISDYLSRPDISKQERAYYGAWYDFARFVTTSSVTTETGKNAAFGITWLGSTVAKLVNLWDGIAGRISTRSTNLMGSVVKLWSDSMTVFGDWEHRNGPQVKNALFNAAESHAADLGETDKVGRVTRWYDQIGRELFARAQQQNASFSVGDVLPDARVELTKEDIEVLKVQVAATDKAHNLDLRDGDKNPILRSREFLPEGQVDDQWIPGITVSRRPLKTNENLLFRRFNPQALFFANRYVNADAREQRSLLDEHFNQFVLSFLSDRDAGFARDNGLEEIYSQAAERVRDGEISTMDELDAFIEQNAYDNDQAVGITHREMTRLLGTVDRLAAKRVPGRTVDITELEASSSFTKGRGRRIAPYWFYNHGFRSTSDIRNFALQGSQKYLKEFSELGRGVLNQMESDLQERLRQAQVAGQSRAQAQRSSRRAVKEGQEQVSLDDLEWGVSALRNYIDEVEKTYTPGGRMSQDDLVTAFRLFGLSVGSILTSPLTLIRNLVQGGMFFNAQRMNRITGASLKWYPHAIFQVGSASAKATLSGILSAGVASGSVLKNIPGAVREVGIGVGRAVTLRPGFLEGILKAEANLFGDAIEEMASGTFRRLRTFKELEDNGYGMVLNHREHLRTFAHSIATWGEIVESEGDIPKGVVPFLTKMAKSATGLVDFHLTMLFKPFFPRAGDIVANMAAMNTATSAVRSFEAHLRKRVMRAVKNNRPFKLERVGPEILPAWTAGIAPATVESNLNDLKTWFNVSGIDLLREVNEFMDRLSQAAPDQRRNVQFLTDEQIFDLGATHMEEVNFPTTRTRPEAARRNSMTRIVFALMGWNLKTFVNWTQHLSTAVNSRGALGQLAMRAALASFVASSLLFAAGSEQLAEEIARIVYRNLFNQERNTRQPWERDDGKAFQQLIVQASTAIPYLSTAVNAAFNDLPSKGGQISPTFLGQNLAVSVIDYVGGAVNTGSPTYGLDRLIRQFNPFLGQVNMAVNPTVNGRLEALNVRRLLSRYGSEGMLRKSVAGNFSALATETSPFGGRMLNAAMQGDLVEFRRWFNEGKAAAEAAGKADPERSMKQIFSLQNPYTRAFRSKISPSERMAILSRMTESERRKTLAVEELFRRAGNSIGLNITFTSDDSLPTSVAVTPRRTTRSRTARTRRFSRARSARLRRQRR